MTSVLSCFFPWWYVWEFHITWMLKKATISHPFLRVDKAMRIYLTNIRGFTLKFYHVHQPLIKIFGSLPTYFLYLKPIIFSVFLIHMEVFKFKGPTIHFSNHHTLYFWYISSDKYKKFKLIWLNHYNYKNNN